MAKYTHAVVSMDFNAGGGYTGSSVKHLCHSKKKAEELFTTEAGDGWEVKNAEEDITQRFGVRIIENQSRHILMVSPI